MENLTYADNLKQSGNLLALAERASALLEEVLGASASLASAEWDCAADDRGRAVVTLRLWDSTGEARTRFTPKELTDPNRLRVRFHRLWGDILQIRSHKQLQELTDTRGSTGD